MTSVLSPPTPEAIEQFPCFGGACMVLVHGPGASGSALQAAAAAKRRLRDWHVQFSRFDRSSELSALNRDSRSTVPVSPIMARFVEAAVHAASITGGLVDPTLVGELERAGYAEDLGTPAVPPADALRLAPARHAASPSAAARWRQVSVDRLAGTVTRPPGVRLDSGGIAKGLFGDVLAAVLGWHRSFAVQAAGDVRFGGAPGMVRPVHVISPFDDSVLHTFELIAGAAATSGIAKRSWLGPDRRPAHHLLDPATGLPAFTGVVQATALAPSGVEAEALAKAALLSGPDRATGWLRHGGVVVYENGGHDVIDPALGEALR
jgi:thiamine biosynthesis lipoprotein